jgi:hypothetical protein
VNKNQRLLMKAARATRDAFENLRQAEHDIEDAIRTGALNADESILVAQALRYVRAVGRTVGGRKGNS